MSLYFQVDNGKEERGWDITIIFQFKTLCETTSARFKKNSTTTKQEGDYHGNSLANLTQNDSLLCKCQVFFFIQENFLHKNLWINLWIHVFFLREILFLLFNRRKVECVWTKTEGFENIPENVGVFFFFVFHKIPFWSSKKSKTEKKTE